MPNVYTALSGGTATTNGGLGGGQYTSADNVGTFTPSNGAGLVQKASHYPRKKACTQP